MLSALYQPGSLQDSLCWVTPHAVFGGNASHSAAVGEPSEGSGLQGFLSHGIPTTGCSCIQHVLGLMGGSTLRGCIWGLPSIEGHPEVADSDSNITNCKHTDTYEVEHCGPSL